MVFYCCPSAAWRLMNEKMDRKNHFFGSFLSSYPSSLLSAFLTSLRPFLPPFLAAPHLPCRILTSRAMMVPMTPTAPPTKPATTSPATWIMS